MALTTSLVCPLVSPITGKTLQYFLRSSGRRHTSGQAVAALHGGSRRWQGDTGETGLTAEPWGPLARQGMCRDSICCQEDFRRPLTHAQQRSGESGQQRSREERWLEISQNQTEGSWRMGEGRPLVDLPDPHDRQLGGLRKRLWTWFWRL